MEVGTMEGRIDLEDLGDTDSLLESSPAANEETSKTEETSMMQPEDLEHEEKKQKRAVAKKPSSNGFGGGPNKLGEGGTGLVNRPALERIEPAPPPFF